MPALAATPQIQAPLDLQSLRQSGDYQAVQQQFESIFYAMMIKELRQTVSGGGLFPGESTDSYGVLFDQFMGQHLAQAQPLGIGRMLAAYHEAAATA